MKTFLKKALYDLFTPVGYFELALRMVIGFLIGAVVTRIVLAVLQATGVL